MTAIVAELHRYPVKSMLGEVCETIELDRFGVVGDRTQALIDVASGRVATAKQPRWWRALLRCRAATTQGGIEISLPDGRLLDSLAADDALSDLLGRPVRMSQQRADGAEIERPDPEQVLSLGVDAALDAPVLELAMGAPGGRFVDFAPVHLITTATLDAVGVETLRYRPNLVIATEAGSAPYSENDWVGRSITVGGVRLTGLLPTPRCSVPTLEHGGLPRSTAALRTPTTHNRVWIDLLEASVPCVGLYATVTVGGTVQVGDPVEVGDRVEADGS